MTNRGQVLVESAFSLFLMSGFITSFLLALYSLFLNLWIPHLLYENSVCRASVRGSLTCDVVTHERLRSLLFGVEKHFEFRSYQKARIYGASFGLRLKSQVTLLFREEVHL